MRVEKKEIRQAYNGFKDLAEKHLNAHNVNKALWYMDCCAVLAQQFNWIYVDDELELMEKRIGKSLFPHLVTDYETNPEHVVFFDDYCATFILAVQYLDSLSAMGKKVLYITSNCKKSKVTQSFFDRISQIPNVEILKVKGRLFSDVITSIYQVVLDFHPSKLLLHLKANSKIIPALYGLPNQIEKYLINLADQTFWLGARAIDYCIEFRPFGVSVSLERRGLKREQLLMLPFYPVKDPNPFNGFPEEANGHLTIFSGGDIYKTLDSRRTYWKLVKMILDKYPDVVFLFATKHNPIGSSAISKFVSDNHFEGRFIYVGFRPDIYEVLKHCDIYMGTFPASGSLMTQLAAINGTPVLQYYYPGTPDDETEQALCINDKFPISYQNIEDFMQEADRLITNADYRKQQGERIKHAMISPEQFNTALEQTLETNCSQFPVETKVVDYAHLDDRWYELEKCGFSNTLSYVYGKMGKTNCKKYVPTLYYKKQIMTFMKKCFNLDL